jgi:IclR family pca regulon transcriptional regulator
MGSRLPVHCAATGRVLLSALAPDEAERTLQRMARRKLTPHTRTEIPELMALLEETRRLGYATSDEELELGWRSIAIPIYDGTGRTVAAMSLVGSTARFTEVAMVETLLPEIQSGRRMLSNML